VNNETIIQKLLMDMADAKTGNLKTWIG